MISDLICMLLYIVMTVVFAGIMAFDRTDRSVMQHAGMLARVWMLVCIAAILNLTVLPILLAIVSLGE